MIEDSPVPLDNCLQKVERFLCLEQDTLCEDSRRVHFLKLNHFLTRFLRLKCICNDLNFGLIHVHIVSVLHVGLKRQIGMELLVELVPRFAHVDELTNDGEHLSQKVLVDLVKCSFC